MRKTLKLLCVAATLVIFVLGFSGFAHAWDYRMDSDWFGASTGCVTIKVTGDSATIRSYNEGSPPGDSIYYGTCHLSKGSHKFDYKGCCWVIEGDNNSKVTDDRDSGGGCGFKCLKMHGSPD